MNGILGASGRPIVAFGGAHAWKEFTKGDLRISFQWIKTEEDEVPEPCMCLYRANGSHLNSGAYVIPQFNAFRFADSKSGDPTKYLVEASIKIAEQLGWFADSMTCKRIADAIVECLPELIYMPDISEQLLADSSYKSDSLGGEIRVKVNDKVMHEAAV